MDYGRILGRAWRITWRWKILWILGFLAALGRGRSPGNSSSYTFDGSEWGMPIHADRWPEIAGIVAAVACLGLLIVIALWVVSVIARGGLIAGVQQVEDEDSTSFGRAWRVGVSRFWSLFGISFLTALPIIILVIVGLVVLVALGFGTAGAFDISDLAGASGVTVTVICGGALCCGGAILAIALALLRTYAERAAVLEGLGWIDAIRRGWQVIKRPLREMAQPKGLWPAPIPFRHASMACRMSVSGSVMGGPNRVLKECRLVPRAMSTRSRQSGGNARKAAADPPLRAARSLAPTSTDLKKT